MGEDWKGLLKKKGEPMSVDLKRFTKLKEQVEDLQRKKDRAEGALSQLMKKLKEEFDCESLEEGEELLGKVSKQAKEAERKFSNTLEEFEEDWADVLNEEKK